VRATQAQAIDDDVDDGRLHILTRAIPGVACDEHDHGAEDGTLGRSLLCMDGCSVTGAV